MKNKILHEFLDSNIKIKSQEKLEQYIDYCIEHNQNEKILNEAGYSKTAHHHILPEALFEQFCELKKNLWNGTHLFYHCHYYAHWLLTEAIDDYGQLYAFYTMHYRDVGIGRLTEDDLIPSEDFQTIAEEARIQGAKKGKEVWARPGYKEKMSEIAKEVWDDPIYHAKMSKIRKEQWNNPGTREKTSKSLIDIHANPKYKRKFIETMTEVNQCEEKRQAAGISLKNLWKTDEYRDKTIQARLKSYVIVDLEYNIIEEFKSRIELDKTVINVQKFLDSWEPIHMKNPNRQKYNGLILLRCETYDHYKETDEKLFKKKRVFRKKIK